MHRQKTVLSIILLLVLSFAQAEDATLVFGGAKGWSNMSELSGLSRGKGRLGQDALVLSTMLPLEASVDDMYLSFDGAKSIDESGNYTVVSSALLFAGEAKAERGTGAALCNTGGKGLVLRGKPGSIFSTPGNPGSFTIAFWLFPAVTENGSILFQWRSSRTAGATSLYQYIRSSLFQNHVEWAFSNIWTTVTGKPHDVTVIGMKNLIPGQWSHHELSYDANSGVLEYCVDGSTESIQYITASGAESGDVYPAIFGAPADVEIASQFSGLIDEFRITRSPSDFSTLETKRAVLERYPSGGGRFRTNPVDTGGLNSLIKGITVVESLPEETGTAFFIRSGDNFYRWTDDFPEWIPVRSGDALSGVKGRYFQIEGSLYPDGGGTKTPSVTSVSVRFEKDTLPWPPAKVEAVSGNGSVKLTWAASIDSDTAGYVVYFGDRPGEYLGEGSPADAGKNLSIDLSGLKNGKLYYFCIASYDESGMRYPGSLSKEVWARPQASR